MESSRLREHGSRLPMSWDRGGTTTARGRRCPGWGMQTAGGRAPAGGWGGRPCRLNGVNIVPSRLEEPHTARLSAPRGTRPGPSLTTCLVERVADPRPRKPRLRHPGQLLCQQGPARIERSRDTNLLASREFPLEPTWRYRKISSSVLKKCFINGLKNV